MCRSDTLYEAFSRVLAGVVEGLDRGALALLIGTVSDNLAVSGQRQLAVTGHFAVSAHIGQPSFSSAGFCQHVPMDYRRSLLEYSSSLGATFSAGGQQFLHHRGSRG